MTVTMREYVPKLEVGESASVLQASGTLVCWTFPVGTEIVHCFLLILRFYWLAMGPVFMRTLRTLISQPSQMLGAGGCAGVACHLQLLSVSFLSICAKSPAMDVPLETEKLRNIKGCSYLNGKNSKQRGPLPSAHYGKPQ